MENTFCGVVLSGGSGQLAFPSPERFGITIDRCGKFLVGHSATTPQESDSPTGRWFAEVWLEKLAPHEPVGHYHHNRTGEDNADAHMKRQIMGREAVVAVIKGKLDFGPWEQIFYGEFDGRRRKRVLVKIIGE